MLYFDFEIPEEDLPTTTFVLDPEAYYADLFASWQDERDEFLDPMPVVEEPLPVVTRAYKLEFTPMPLDPLSFEDLLASHFDIGGPLFPEEDTFFPFDPSVAPKLLTPETSQSKSEHSAEEPTAQETNKKRKRTDDDKAEQRQTKKMKSEAKQEPGDQKKALANEKARKKRLEKIEYVAGLEIKVDKIESEYKQLIEHVQEAKTEIAALTQLRNALDVKRQSLLLPSFAEHLAHKPSQPSEMTPNDGVLTRRRAKGTL